MRARWAEKNPESLKGAVRALARAGQFCDAPENASYTGALLSRHRYLDVDSHAVLSSLPGGAIASRNVSRFWRHAATFPWASHGLWFLASNGAMGLDRTAGRQPHWRRVSIGPTFIGRRWRRLGVDVPLADSKAKVRTTAHWELEALPHPIAMGRRPFLRRGSFSQPGTATDRL